MRSFARALGAVLVIGTLFAPYAQPVLCGTLMEQGMDMPQGHAGHTPDTAAPRLGDATASTPCVPLCVVTHVAPPPDGAPVAVALAHSATEVFATPAPRSIIIPATLPPPRS